MTMFIFINNNNVSEVHVTQMLLSIPLSQPVSPLLQRNHFTFRKIKVELPCKLLIQIHIWFSLTQLGVNCKFWELQAWTSMLLPALLFQTIPVMNICCLQVLSLKVARLILHLLLQGKGCQKAIWISCWDILDIQLSSWQLLLGILLPKTVLI